MRIRLAEINDAAEVAQVNARSWQGAYPGIIPDAALARMVAEQSGENYWRKIIEVRSRLHVTIVVENDAGQIVGCATFGPERLHNRQYRGELYSLYLLPDYRRKGLGRALVAEAAQQLKAHGMPSMLVWALTDNHAARQFYERLGGTWLCEGVFDASGVRLPTVAYGWLDVSVLVPQTATITVQREQMPTKHERGEQTELSPVTEVRAVATPAYKEKTVASAQEESTVMVAAREEKAAAFSVFEEKVAVVSAREEKAVVAPARESQAVAPKGWARSLMDRLRTLGRQRR